MSGKDVIFGQSLKNKVVVTVIGNGPFRVERLKKGVEGWEVWTETGFSADPAADPTSVPVGDILDNQGITDGLYTYRCVKFDIIDPTPEKYTYSNWVRCGSIGPVGWSFGNYAPPPGEWGEVCTPDDFRFTWIWGTDFKATNGMSFTDEQIRYYIDAAMAEMERRLNITIKKVRVRCNPEERHLVKGTDYDVEEGYYQFRMHKIERQGLISTRKKPINKLHKLRLLSRYSAPTMDLTDSTIVEKTKGLLRFTKRPIRPSETSYGIQTAINPYGSELLNPYLFYLVDYDAGYDSAADVPADLRHAIGMMTAIALLNIIGDGLMSGFSSSSLSMDGMSESFSSTQSATSAYFGARIKVYEDELAGYISDTARKFGFLQMGSI
ncbi:hypothetical protein FACS1894137_07350 [Spirochaetia bacterium]|nr:hypothetical protein FACS1894137_07350 [Spirochaetia bacterium]